MAQTLAMFRFSSASRISKWTTANKQWNRAKWPEAKMNDPSIYDLDEESAPPREGERLILQAPTGRKSTQVRRSWTEAPWDLTLLILQPRRLATACSQSVAEERGAHRSGAATKLADNVSSQQTRILFVTEGTAPDACKSPLDGSPHSFSTSFMNAIFTVTSALPAP
jgi:HrpA-like RNA helicase